MRGPDIIEIPLGVPAILTPNSFQPEFAILIRWHDLVKGLDHSLTSKRLFPATAHDLTNKTDIK